MKSIDSTYELQRNQALQAGMPKSHLEEFESKCGKSTTALQDHFKAWKPMSDNFQEFFSINSK